MGLLAVIILLPLVGDARADGPASGTNRADAEAKRKEQEQAFYHGSIGTERSIPRSAGPLTCIMPAS
jgi:hypothetical protein